MSGVDVEVKLVCEYCGYEFPPFYHPPEKWIPTPNGVKGYVRCRCGWIPVDKVKLVVVR